MNSEAESTKRVQALFSPISFLLREKRYGRRRHAGMTLQSSVARTPENVNRNFRILGPVPVGNAVAKSGRFMYNTEKDYVALRLLNRRDSYQKERQI